MTDGAVSQEYFFTGVRGLCLIFPMPIWKLKRPIHVTCARAITPFLRQEILALGFPVFSETVAAVETEGTLWDSVRMNLHLRTGHHVLYLLGEFRARDADALYRNLSKLPWEDYLPRGGYLSVSSSVQNPTIRDSRYANVRCKDAVVDRIRQKTGSRPDAGSSRREAVLYLFWKDDLCRIYADTSGEPLSRRGYRKIPLVAPMQETLAAAVVMATGWDGSHPFVNPMCGSGTLAIEAALIALNRAPGLLRDNFGFMHFLGFDEAGYRSIREKARRLSKKLSPGRILASDISPDAVDASRRNAATAGVEKIIEFSLCDFSQTPVPDGEGGVVVFNPEYGERLGERKKLEGVYEGIGDFFKKNCQGYRGYIFTGNLDLAKKVGLRTRRRTPFFNSNIECRLLEYELYEGSRRRPKDPPSPSGEKG